MMQVNAVEGAEVRDVEDIGTLTVRLPAAVVTASLQYAETLDMLGERVKAIKFLRWQFEVGLKEAHRLVVSMARDRKHQPPKRVDRVVSCDSCGWNGPDTDQWSCPACGSKYDYSKGVFSKEVSA